MAIKSLWPMAKKFEERKRKDHVSYMNASFRGIHYDRRGITVFKRNTWMYMSSVIDGSKIGLEDRINRTIVYSEIPLMRAGRESEGQKCQREAI